jgi:hypothetical protein
MTDPSAVSSRYAGTDADFLNTKVDRSGALRMEYFTATIADAASVGTQIGLVPFQKGARFVQGASTFHVTDIDTGTNVTLNLGYVYDDNSNNTNDSNAFATLVTSGQAGGLITFDEHAGLVWEATAPGWIVAEIAGGAVTTAGTIKGQAVLSYDAT